jgi:hypothetical protein
VTEDGHHIGVSGGMAVDDGICAQVALDAVKADLR